MAEHFVSEAIKPAPGAFDASRMVIGEPGVPLQFAWRGETVVVTALMESWKSHSDCRHGGDEIYLRKHWYRVRSEDGRIWTIYCDRQARRGASQKRRWWLYAVSDAP